MRAVIQRVSQAAVTVDGDVIGRIGPGFVVLLGVATDDTQDDVIWMAGKVDGLRAFEDDEGRMNLALQDVGGSVLVVSQFTLLGDCRKGRRPGFVTAAPPEIASSLYQSFVAELRGHGLTVETGQFQAHMEVNLCNDGPVTLLLDSTRTF
ncbi:MAG: D-aminoacyl-tRNA deacylase [Fuerstiella sp.]|nr:D-aminoacyl-tRNA deacylase [Fuerstiella sp.]